MKPAVLEMLLKLSWTEFQKGQNKQNDNVIFETMSMDDKYKYV